MKLRKGFVLRSVADRTVVVPDNEILNLHMMITLNGTGKFLWGRLEKGATEDELRDALLAEYDVDEKRAQEDVKAFLATLEKHGCLEEI